MSAAGSVLALITDALIESDWLAQGEQPNAQDSAFALRKLNYILSTWSAKTPFAYANIFELFTLVPGLAPHTIGAPGTPSPTFPVTYRPVKLIEPAAIVLSNADGTTTDLPIGVKDAQWWAEVRIKNMQSAIPEAVYYEPDWPLGSLFFWPVPNQAYQVRLQFWSAITQFTSIQQAFSMPPGYDNALMLTLAESLAGPRSQDPILLKQAADARGAITANNNQAPHMRTDAAGLGGETRSSFAPDFNFLDGTPW